MRRHSYGYRPFLQNEFTDQLFPLVLTSPRWAGRYGFAGGSRAALADPNQQYLARTSKHQQELFQQALDGAPSGPGLQVSVPGEGVIGEAASGCYAYAQQRLYGNAAGWFGAHALASLARMMVISRVERARSFQPAVAAWSSCMRRHGLDYPSPQVAKEAATTPGKAPGHPRIAIAVTEAVCASQTPLARVSATLFSKEAERLPGLFKTALRVEMQLELSSVHRAVLIASGRVRTGSG
jgi:hypothetical protein